ncbi:MAG TPA: UPF0158 family protein [Flavitalea sp.]|nr:UPF0158 family protein [Flavitalea sp.]
MKDVRKQLEQFFMEVPREILNDIADSMEAGFKCFIHRETLEVVTYLDPDRYPDLDPKDWKEEIGKVRKNKKNFIEIEAMDSRESFRVMAEFAESLENNTTKIKLVTALEGRKPFGNFKHQIENSGEYRELWFVFRREKNIEWIQNQLPTKSL